MTRQSRRRLSLHSLAAKDRNAIRSFSLRGVRLTRRRVLLGATLFVGGGAAVLLAAAQQEAASGPELVLYRDPGCGCCEKWAKGLEGIFTVRPLSSTRLHEVRQRLGVPDDLAGCHTATVDGLIIEGHVPVQDIRRVLRERPPGIWGLAVPGMPVGSPGMESEDGTSEPYEVIAFGPGGERPIFARHGR
jgi:hypothetical protein